MKATGPNATTVARETNSPFFLCCTEMREIVMQQEEKAPFRWYWSIFFPIYSGRAFTIQRFCSHYCISMSQTILFLALMTNSATKKSHISAADLG